LFVLLIRVVFVATFDTFQEAKNFIEVNGRGPNNSFDYMLRLPSVVLSLRSGVFSGQVAPLVVNGQ